MLLPEHWIQLCDHAQELLGNVSARVLHRLPDIQVESTCFWDDRSCHSSFRLQRTGNDDQVVFELLANVVAGDVLVTGLIRCPVLRAICYETPLFRVRPTTKAIQEELRQASLFLAKHADIATTILGQGSKK